MGLLYCISREMSSLFSPGSSSHLNSAHLIILLFLPYPSSMSVTSLEAELQAKIQETYPELRRVYFNKGL